MNERIRYVDPTNATRFDDQVTLGLASLFCLPGIPCVYYGTEQGLSGHGSEPEAVREALWGGPGFATAGDTYYEDVAAIAKIRRECPALRYGRFYFRPVSGDGKNFGVSPYKGGVLAFSRILMDQEILVVANTDTQNSHHVECDCGFDAACRRGIRCACCTATRHTPAAPWECCAACGREMLWWRRRMGRRGRGR